MCENPEDLLVGANVPQRDGVVGSSADYQVWNIVELNVRHESLVAYKGPSYLALFKVVHVYESVIWAWEQPRLVTSYPV